LVSDKPIEALITKIIYNLFISTYSYAFIFDKLEKSLVDIFSAKWYKLDPSATALLFPIIPDTEGF